MKMESLGDQSIRKYGTWLGEKIGAKEFSEGLLSVLFGFVHKKLISPYNAAMEANISEAGFPAKMAGYRSARA